MICFNCEKEIPDTNDPCPYCGYKFTADEDYNCPNLEGTTCPFTNEICEIGEDFQICSVKAAIERGDSVN